MVSWYQASERRRSRADLTKRQVRRALTASSAGSAAAPHSTGTGVGRRELGSKFQSSRTSLGGVKGAGETAPMSPLKGRSLRLSYGGPGINAFGGGASSVVTASPPTNSRSRALVVPANNGNRPGPSADQGAEPPEPPQPWRSFPDRVIVDRLTAHAIQLEVWDLPLPASVCAVAQALGGCPQVRLLHGRSSWDDEIRPAGGDGGAEVGRGEGEGEFADENLLTNSCYPSDQDCYEEETPEERTIRRVGQLCAALQTLTSRVGSTTQVVESWDEARAVLGEVLVFPDEYQQGGRANEMVRGEEEDNVGEDLDELEREQRALEQGQKDGGGVIVPIPSSTTTKKRIGTVSSLLQRRSAPSSSSSSGRLGKAYRSTQRTLAKAARGARARSNIISNARRNFLTKAAYSRMLARRGQLERMRKFKLLTSTVVPPHLVSVVPPPPPSTTTVRWTGDDGIVEKETEEEEQQRKQKEAEAAQARAKAIAALSGLAKLDHLADQRLVEAEQVARARIDAETARQDAEMAAREQAEEEAAAQANRASTLLRDLTDDEAAIVRDAIYGIGRPDEILATSETDSVQRQSLHKLQPGVWLNDEVIHYFLLMLARRDAELAAKQQPGRKRCHFFKSFFITKLLDEAGGYNYKNVKRWSRKVPGKDIFALDKIFFPGQCV